MPPTVAHDPPVASVGRRLVAYVLDAVMLYLSIGVVFAGGIGLALQALLGPPWMQLPGALWAFVFVFVSLPLWAYFTWCEGGPRQATLGMRALGLQVRTTDGSPVGRPRALLRTVVKLLPFEINHLVMLLPVPLFLVPDSPRVWLFAIVYALLALYLGLAFASPRRQSLHDRVAGTVVVRVPRTADDRNADGVATPT